MVAVLVILFLLLRVQSAADVNERSIRLLVEALGQERFDWERAAALPEGPRLVTVSPAFNEAENVGRRDPSHPETSSTGIRVVPVVVSDGSEDRTAEVARAAGAFVAELPIRRGGGLALARGLRHRVEARGRHRRDARRRRTAPARGDPGDDRPDRRRARPTT